MKKEQYVVPELKVTYFEEKDVIVTSSVGGIDEGDGGNPFGQ